MLHNIFMFWAKTFCGTISPKTSLQPSNLIDSSLYSSSSRSRRRISCSAAAMHRSGAFRASRSTPAASRARTDFDRYETGVVDDDDDEAPPATRRFSVTGHERHGEAADATAAGIGTGTGTGRRRFSVVTGGAAETEGAQEGSGKGKRRGRRRLYDGARARTGVHGAGDGVEVGVHLRRALFSVVGGAAGGDVSGGEKRRRVRRDDFVVTGAERTQPLAAMGGRRRLGDVRQAVEAQVAAARGEAKMGRGLEEGVVVKVEGRARMGRLVVGRVLGGAEVGRKIAVSAMGEESDFGEGGIVYVPMPWTLLEEGQGGCCLGLGEDIFGLLVGCVIAAVPAELCGAYLEVEEGLRNATEVDKFGRAAADAEAGRRRRSGAVAQVRRHNSLSSIAPHEEFVELEMSVVCVLEEDDWVIVEDELGDVAVLVIDEGELDTAGVWSVSRERVSFSIVQMLLHHRVNGDWLIKNRMHDQTPVFRRAGR